MQNVVKITSCCVTSLLRRIISSKLHSTAACALYLSLAFAFFSAAACIKRQYVDVTKTAKDQQPVQANAANQAKRININTASAEELEKLPGIGKALAERIIEHREKYGTFRRVEHLIMVRGISDQKFRALRDLVTVD